MTKIKFLRVIIFILFFFNNKTLIAQLKDSYIKGTIELQSGEIVNGFIKEDAMENMNYKVIFKHYQLDSKAISYDTSTIKGYKLENGDIYQLKSFRTDTMKSDISVLAKLIIKGKASLYKIIYKTDPLFLIYNVDKVAVLQNDYLEDFALQITTHYYKNRLVEALIGLLFTEEKLYEISFSEKCFKKMVSEYNTTLGFENTVIIEKPNNIHFLIGTISGMKKSMDENEYSFQGTYRIYIPRISRSTSANIGFNFYSYQYSLSYEYLFKTYTTNYKTTLISIPFQVQQNLLNKGLRPYLFCGINLSYLKVIDDKGESRIENGFQKNFGIGFLYGGGIEIDIYKRLMIKAEYRSENFKHLPLVGLSYIFSQH